MTVDLFGRPDSQENDELDQDLLWLDLFEEGVGPIEWYGEKQWEESRLVCDKAHEGFADENRNYRSFRFYIPTGAHFMIAYFQFKAGRLSEEAWTAYRNQYPWPRTGRGAINTAVGRFLRSSLYDDLHTNLHWLAIGNHPSLIPKQMQLNLPEPPQRRLVSNDPDYQEAVDLLRVALRRMTGSLARCETLAEAKRYLERTEPGPARDLIREILRGKFKDSKNEYDDDMPF